MARLLSYALALEQNISANWIISRRADLLWFIGGALAGYAFVFYACWFGLGYGDHFGFVGGLAG